MLLEISTAMINFELKIRLFLSIFEYDRLLLSLKHLWKYNTVKLSIVDRPNMQPTGCISCAFNINMRPPNNTNTYLVVLA